MNCAEIESKTNIFIYTRTNEFADGKYNEIYKGRFPNSECINGFHKTKDILKLLCQNLTANQNEMLLRNLLYTIKQLKSLKRTCT